MSRPGRRKMETGWARVPVRRRAGSSTRFARPIPAPRCAAGSSSTTPRTLELPAHSAPGRGAGLLGSKAVRRVLDAALPTVARKILGPTFGHDMVFHRASEMNHLASFLPDLYAEFNGTP
jgi:DAPG hydrolase PhiG domain